MACTTAGFGRGGLARCGSVRAGSGCGSGGGLEGDGVAEGFELPDQVVDLAGGVDAVVVEVGAEVVVPGGRVGQQVPDDHEDGSGDGDEGLAFAAAGDQASVAFGQERVAGAGTGRCGDAEGAFEVGVA